MVQSEGEEKTYGGNLTDIDKRILAICGSQPTEDEESSSGDEDMGNENGLPDVCVNGNPGGQENGFQDIRVTGIPGVPESVVPGLEDEEYGFAETSSEGGDFEDFMRYCGSSEVLNTVKIQNGILERISSSLAVVSETSTKRLKMEERKLKMKEKAVELKEKKLMMKEKAMELKEKKLKMKEKAMMLKEKRVVLAERRVPAAEREANCLEKNCSDS